MQYCKKILSGLRTVLQMSPSVNYATHSVLQLPQFSRELGWAQHKQSLELLHLWPEKSPTEDFHYPFFSTDFISLVCKLYPYSKFGQVNFRTQLSSDLFNCSTEVLSTKMLSYKTLSITATSVVCDLFMTKFLNSSTGKSCSVKLTSVNAA